MYKHKSIHHMSGPRNKLGSLLTICDAGVDGEMASVRASENEPGAGICCKKVFVGLLTSSWKYWGN